jgi:hypothetical protein
VTPAPSPSAAASSNMLTTLGYHYPPGREPTVIARIRQ